MPRSNSRTARAHQLVKDLMHGPNDIANGPANITPDAYNLWLSTWVIPSLTKLIPELKDLDYRYASSKPQTPIIPGYTTRKA